eukprot:TRINITY_DN1302_c0_g2_i1.p1 TRINITY_DN1302_c0_g2~~TRINITY_DN1302_c0_g2_i1.p1  ORF type:complete len:372 (+),score=61.37 TRINITY_DN1302_c0_g2_i1:64-1116(+)
MLPKDVLRALSKARASSDDYTHAFRTLSAAAEKYKDNRIVVGAVVSNTSKIWEEAKCNGVPLQKMSGLLALRIAGRLKQIPLMEEFYSDMRTRGETCSRVQRTRLSGYTHSETALDISSIMKDVKKPITVDLFNGLLAYHASRRDMMAFTSVLSRMKDMKIKPDQHTWGIRIKTAHSLEKIEYLVERSGRSVVALEAAISSIRNIHPVDFDKAVSYHRQIPSRSIRHFNELLLCCRSSDHVKDVLRMMQAMKVLPNAMTYDFMIRRSYGDLPLAEAAFAHAVADGLKDSRHLYTSMLRLYASAHNSSRSTRYQNEIREKARNVLRQAREEKCLSSTGEAVWNETFRRQVE